MLNPYHQTTQEALDSRPEHIAIVALGRSKAEFIDRIQDYGAFQSFPDEIWGINACSIFLKCHKLWIADGFKHQFKKQNPNCGLYAEWLKKQTTPLFTTENHPDAPMAVQIPIQQIINATKQAQFGNTLSYALGYACMLRILYGCVKRIDVFGAEFHYKDHKSGEQVLGEIGHEKAAAWGGFARGLGIDVCVATTSQFMGGSAPEFYGFKDKVPNFELPDGTFLHPTGKPA